MAANSDLAGSTSADGTGRSLATSTRRPRKARAFWIKQLHSWHSVSAALSLAGMLLFAITGLTLNHAGSIPAVPQVTRADGVLPPALAAMLVPSPKPDSPLPGRVAASVRAQVGLDPAGRPAEWSADEVYVALPSPGADAWVSIDRASGRLSSERTWRGWISYLNDLHKGRNAGAAWFWFIDAFAGACILFTLTGLVLLQLHARHRPATWPSVAIGLALPILLALFLVH